MKKKYLIITFTLVISSNAVAGPGLTSIDKHVIAGDQAMRQHNYAIAESNFLVAAKNGDSDAEMMLGKLYLQGTKLDYAKAHYWSNKAARKGNAGALLNMGLIYREGLGVNADQDKALNYFQQAAYAGQFKSNRYIGLYFSEHGDAKRAVSYYQKAADQGDITSQFYLGQAYQYGKGIKQDFELAKYWYEKSASRGDIIASDGMTGLASLYEHGDGVPIDVARAKELYKNAARTGNTFAIEQLKRLSEKNDIERNLQ